MSRPSGTSRIVSQHIKQIVTQRVMIHRLIGGSVVSLLFTLLLPHPSSLPMAYREAFASRSVIG